MVDKITIKDNSLIINELELELPNTIEEYVFVKNLIVVRTSHVKGKLNQRNVFAFNDQGELVWRILPDSKNPKFSYVSIGSHDKKVYAVNFSGLHAEIDPDTGTFIKTEYRK